MEFQTFGGIRLENFAFKFDLNDFFEAVKVKTFAFLASKKYSQLFKTKMLEAGAYSPFFSSNLHENLQITKIIRPSAATLPSPWTFRILRIHIPGDAF